MTTTALNTATAVVGFDRVSMQSDGLTDEVTVAEVVRLACELAKTASAAVVSLPSIVVVFLVAAVVKDVRLDAWQWLALTGAIWAGSLVFVSLGVAIGYLASGDAVRPITMIIYFGLSILGGLWMPTTSFPGGLQDIAKWVPTHAYAALGQAIEQSRAPHAKDLVVLVVSFALFTGGAAWLYRKDTLKA